MPLGQKRLIELADGMDQVLPVRDYLFDRLKDIGHEAQALHAGKDGVQKGEKFLGRLAHPVFIVCADENVAGLGQVLDFHHDAVVGVDSDFPEVF